MQVSRPNFMKIDKKSSKIYSKFSVAIFGLLLLQLTSAKSLNAQQSPAPSNIQSLSLGAAIAEALVANHQVQIAKNNAVIAEKGDHIGFAGLLPELNATAGYQYSESNTTLEFANAQPGQPANIINVDGAVSTTRNAGLNATYTLFDGLANIQTKRRLGVLNTLADLQLRQQMEATVALVTQTYALALLSVESVNISQKSIDRSLVRLARANKNFELGLVNRIEVLTAEVDLNADSLSYKTAVNDQKAAFRALQLELGREEIASNYEVDLVQPDLIKLPLLEEIQENALSLNALLVANSLQMETAVIDYKITNSAFSPRLLASGSYSYIRTENDAGILAFQENTGFTGGLTLNVGLFNGFRRSIQKQTASLSVKNAQLTQERSKLEISAAVNNAWDSFETAVYQAEIQLRNVETAKLSFERSENLYQNGQINAVQIRDTQLTLQQSEFSLFNLQLQAFLAQVELQRLSGKLVSQ